MAEAVSTAVEDFMAEVASTVARERLPRRNGIPRRQRGFVAARSAEERDFAEGQDSRWSVLAAAFAVTASAAAGAARTRLGLGRMGLGLGLGLGPGLGLAVLGLAGYAYPYGYGYDPW